MRERFGPQRPRLENVARNRRGASGKVKWSQIAAIIGIFEDFWGIEGRETGRTTKDQKDQRDERRGVTEGGEAGPMSVGRAGDGCLSLIKTGEK